MKITILTLFPDMFHGFLDTSIIKKARLKNLVEINLVDFREYSTLKTKRVDDYPYGGGSGMVLRYQPVVAALKQHQSPDSSVIMLSPSGNLFNQKLARKLSNKQDLILICGHYEGYDERILQHVDQVISIGDYVLTGGELASMVLSDAVIRLLPEVISDGSKSEESFENELLEYPHYTRPETIAGQKVPDVLISGNHQKIAEYRLKESFKKTLIYRPDLIKNYKFDKAALKSFKQAKDELKED